MAETKKTVQTAAEHQKRLDAFYDEKVPLFIRRPEREPENGITVTLNGKNYRIQYDKTVMVPRRIALIVEESERGKRMADAAMYEKEGMHELS